MTQDFLKMAALEDLSNEIRALHVAVADLALIVSAISSGKDASEACADSFYRLIEWAEASIEEIKAGMKYF